MKTFDEPITFEDAEAFLRKKGLLPTDLSSADLRELDADIKRKAMFSARVADAGHLQRLQELTAKIAGGPDSADFAARAAGTKPLLVSIPEAKAQLLEYLKSTGYKAEEGEEGTIKDLSSDSRLQLQVETNVLDAQGYGRFRATQNRASLDQFPAWELVRMRFSKVPRDWEERWEAARDGTTEEGSTESGERMVALKNHPIWQALGDGEGGYEDTLGNPWPPFAFNSGMNVIDVSRDEAVGLGIIGEETEVPLAEDPMGMNDGLEASVAGYAEFLTDALKAVKGLFFDKGVLTLANESGVTLLRNNVGRCIGMLLPTGGPR